MSRGAHAGGLGWLLRSFYRDHVRLMDVHELALFEAVLATDAAALAEALVQRPARDAALEANHVFRTLRQYWRYWGGAGHARGGEYR